MYSHDLKSQLLGVFLLFENCALERSTFTHILMSCFAYINSLFMNGDYIALP
jgi:hypothetical protein